MASAPPPDKELEEGVVRAKERILRRVPSHIARGRIVETLVEDVATEVALVERGIQNLMESRWIDVAEGSDLDGTASLFLLRRAPEEGDEAFRHRILLTLREILAGSGTIESLKKIIMATLGIEPEIIENPPMRRYAEFKVGTGGDFTIRNRGLGTGRVVALIRPMINIKDIKITCVTSGSSVRFDHQLRQGDMLLLLPEGRAILNGEDVTQHMDPKATPVMPRGESLWRYSDNQGRFNYSQFDESVFAGSRGNVVEVGINWEERTPATVKISLPLEITRQDQVYLQREMRNLANKVRTAGVAQLINFYDVLTESNPPQLEQEPTIRAVKDFVEAHISSESFTTSITMEVREEHIMSDELNLGGRFNEARFNDGFARFV